MDERPKLIGNFWEQAKAAEESHDRYVRNLINRLDKKGIKYTMTHDELHVQASPEDMEGILKETTLNVQDAIFGLLAELACKYEVQNGIVYVLAPDGGKWDFTVPLVSTSKNFPEM